MIHLVAVLNWQSTDDEPTDQVSKVVETEICDHELITKIKEVRNLFVESAEASGLICSSLHITTIWK